MLAKTRLCTLSAACFLLACATISVPARAELRLLDQLCETTIEGNERFVAADAFKIGSTIGGRTLSAVGLGFAKHFLGVVESNVPPISLGIWTLQYTAGDTSLVKVLGGERSAAIPFLAHIHRVMAMGTEGAGHTDWRSNFAYMRSPVDGRLWAVHWTVNYAGEWNIGTVSVPHEHLDWRAGSRLFVHAPD